MSNLRTSLAEITFDILENSDTTYTPSLVVGHDETLYSLRSLSHRCWFRAVSVIDWVRGRERPSLESSLKNLFQNDFQRVVLLTYSLHLQRIRASLLPEAEKKFEAICRRLFEKETCEIFTEEDYETIVDLLNKRSLSLEQEENARNQLIKNSYYIFFEFWKLFRHEPKLKESLSPYLPKESVLSHDILYKTLKQEYSLQKLEAITKKPTPLLLLQKLEKCSKSSLDPLNPTEKRRIEEWINRLNQKQQEISSKLFWFVLKEVEKLATLDNETTFSLFALICELKKLGCDLLERRDPFHLEKRNRLNCGSMIKWNHQFLELGKKLGTNKENNRYEVFELSNHPHHVVRIGPNLIDLFIREEEGKNFDPLWGIRGQIGQQFLDKSGLDREGFCVIERKLTPLNFEWKSSSWRLHEDDYRLAFDVANHLFYWNDQNGTPKGISLSSVGKDFEGIIRTFENFHEKEAGHYSHLEACCLEAANGNPHLLRFFIESTGLINHPMRNYFDQTLKHYLDTGVSIILTTELPEDYDYPYNRKRASERLEEFKALVVDCKKRLDERDHHKIPHSLYALSLQSPLASFFSPSLVDETVENLKRGNEEIEQNRVTIEQKNYYEQTHQRLIAINKKKLEKLILEQKNQKMKSAKEDLGKITSRRLSR